MTRKLHRFEKKIMIFGLSCLLYDACMYNYIVGYLSSFDKTTTKFILFIEDLQFTYIFITDILIA